MDLVVDANILFAALIKRGPTTQLLFVDKFHLYAPEYLLDEFIRHKKTILAKTQRTDEDFNKLIEVLQRRIRFIPAEEIKTYMKKATTISPDPDDTPYFALALYLGANIWTNDKELKKQNEIEIYTTTELLQQFSHEI